VAAESTLFKKTVPGEKEERQGEGGDVEERPGYGEKNIRRVATAKQN